VSREGKQLRVPSWPIVRPHNSKGRLKNGRPNKFAAEIQQNFSKKRRSFLVQMFHLIYNVFSLYIAHKIVPFNTLFEISISKRISYVYLSSFLSSPTAAEFIFVRMQQPKLLGQQELATQGTASLLGLATEFRSEKIPRNILRIVSVIPRKKVFIPRHSEVYGRVNSEAQNGRKWHEKN
jgi:hypothetical protein